MKKFFQDIEFSLQPFVNTHKKTFAMPASLCKIFLKTVQDQDG